MRDTDRDKPPQQRGQPGDQKEYRGSHVGRDQSTNAGMSQHGEAAMSEEPPPTEEDAPKAPRGSTGKMPYGGRQEWQGGNHGSASPGSDEDNKE